MEDVLEERLIKLEERLGLTKAANIASINEELNIIRKKLSEAGCGFLLKIPADVLQKINDLAVGSDYLTLEEKRREIEFGHDLMVERARLLEEFQDDSEVVFKSESIANMSHHTPALDSVENEINESALDVQKHHNNVAEIKENFVILIEQLQYQVTEWENIVEKLERAAQQQESRA